MKKLILISMIISSCTPVYFPNARNSPMFTKAGEFQASAQVGNGFEVQSAASVSNHIGLMANYSYSNDNNLSVNSQDRYHYHKLLEGGIGYFENKGPWCYEIFGGYGKGEGASYAYYDFWSSSTYSNARVVGKFDRYFIQPAFALNKKMMNVSFVPRISIVDFKSFSSDSIPTPYVSHSQPQIFFEPAVIGRFNMVENHLFFTFQAGFSFSSAQNVYYDYSFFQFSTGLGFRFGGRKDNAEPKKPDN